MAFTKRTAQVSQAASIAASPWDATAVTKATGTVNGDIMFTHIHIYLGSTAPTVDSVPAGWTQIATNVSSTNYSRWYLYMKIASSEPSSYTWSFTASCRYRIVHTAYSAGDWNPSAGALSRVVVSNTLYGTAGTPIRAAAMTVPWANAPLLFFGSVYSSTSKTFTKPSVPTSGWVEDYDAGSTTPYLWSTIDTFIWSGSGATGTIEGTISATITTEKHAFAVALEPYLLLSVTDGSKLGG